MGKSRHPHGGPPGRQKDEEPIDPVEPVDPPVDEDDEEEVTPIEPVIDDMDGYEFGEWSDTNSFTTQ